MEEIIEKAIKGGWTPNGSILLHPKQKWNAGLVMANYYHQPTYLLIPEFWQALGKACRWKHESSIDSEDRLNGEWVRNTLRFHEINLNEGCEKALEYLQDLIK